MLSINLNIQKIKLNERLEPERQLESVQIGETLEKVTKINAKLTIELKQRLIKFLQENHDPFALTASNMPE